MALARVDGAVERYGAGLEERHARKLAVAEGRLVQDLWLNLDTGDIDSPSGEPSAWSSTGPWQGKR